MLFVNLIMIIIVSTSIFILHKDVILKSKLTFLSTSLYIILHFLVVVLEPFSNVSFLVKFGLSLLLYTVLEDLITRKVTIVLPIIIFFIFSISQLDLSATLLSVLMFFVLFLFSRFGFLNKGEPFVVLPFLLLVDYTNWASFIIFSSVISLFALLLSNRFRVSGVPFAPVLYVVYILFFLK